MPDARPEERLHSIVLASRHATVWSFTATMLIPDTLDATDSPPGPRRPKGA